MKTQVLFVGVLIGGGGNIYKTTDAGSTWFSSFTYSMNFLYDISFIDSLTGFASGADGKLFKSTDCGSTWFLSNNGISGTPNLSCIRFVDNLTGYVTGVAGNIYKTTNCGISWSKIITGTASGFAQLTLKGSNTVYVCGSRIVYRSTDSGINWDSLPVPSKQVLNSIKFLGSHTLITTGNNSEIFCSPDDGADWIQVNDTTRSSFRSSFIFDTTSFVVVGDNGIFKRTTDAGENWFTTTVQNDISLYSVCFVDSNSGFACGGKETALYPFGYSYYGALYRTTDRGITWQTEYANQTCILRDVVFISQNTGFCVGGAKNYFGYDIGRFLKTTDGGSTWLEKPYGSTNSLTSISAVNSKLFVSSTNGTIYSSSNNGDSWETINTGSGNDLIDIVFTSESTGYVTGTRQVLKSTDYGSTWSLQFNAPSTAELTSMSFANDYYGIAVSHDFGNYGRSGDIFLTTNGGLIWSLLSSELTMPTILYGGLNFASISSNGFGIIVGEKGTILVNKETIPVYGIETTQGEVPRNYELYQNYPNPFNPLTRIDFVIPSREKVSISLYDVSGKMIREVLNNILNAGNYSLSFDLSEFASGVYFCKLETEHFSQTRKLVLLK